jgi:hypothetical protein
LIANQRIFLVLSAGVRLRRDPIHRRRRGLRHRLMRHFLRREVGLSVAVPRLSRCLKPASPRRNPICRARPPQRVSPLCRRARQAVATTPITADAQPKLYAAPPTHHNPKRVRSHPAPTADFWTRSSRCDEGAALRRTGDRKARESQPLGLSLFQRARFLARGGRSGPNPRR